jgi:coenzyme F420 biosynthesis associated uncharacterized protein
MLDRPEWIHANVASMRLLLAPLLQRWQQRQPNAVTGISRQVAAAEIGAMLGWMSTRVLGQYDLLLGRAPDDDAVYMVAPNLTEVEHRYGFHPGQFRTWVLLHELTHRAQFTGVPWMRDYFSGLVNESLSHADPDPAALVAAVKSALRNRREAGQHLRDNGVFGLLAPPAQRAVMARIAGLMSLLEGHGDVTMTRAAGPLVPDADRYERILRERRRSISPLSKAILRLVGVEAKLNQYAAGVHFLEVIEESRGRRAVDRCWERPENLPSLDEIRAPRSWLVRMGEAVA